MRPGQLRHRLTFRRPGKGRDAYGQPTTPPETVAEVWGAVRPMGSNERLVAAQRQSSQTHVVSVRYAPTLAGADGAWWIEWGTRTLAINGLARNFDERNRWLEFECTEGLGANG